MPSFGGVRPMESGSSRKEYATVQAVTRMDNTEVVVVGTVGDSGWAGHEVQMTPTRARAFARAIMKSADIAEAREKDKG